MNANEKPPIRIACFDFDGTLRDGLAEKTFAFAKAAEITARLTNATGLRPFGEDDMRRLAGRSIRDICLDVWPKNVRPEIDDDAFASTFERTWSGIYEVKRAPDDMKARVGESLDFLPDETRAANDDMPGAEWFPGVRETITRLSDKGIFVGILSNTPEVSSLRNEAHSGGFGELFDEIHTGAPVKAGKPDPRSVIHFAALAWCDENRPVLGKNIREARDACDSERYAEALEEATASLCADGRKIEIIMIGDGIPDIVAATAAAAAIKARDEADRNVRISSLALTYGFMREEDLVAKGPTAISRSPMETVDKIIAWERNTGREEDRKIQASAKNEPDGIRPKTSIER
jgi:phosphoglycolate phosphatase-like HAD superfamily hydrolase